MTRAEFRKTSNNPDNTNQNVCAQAAADFFGCATAVRYLHTYQDCQRAIGKRFSVRSAKSFAKSRTVGGARANLSAYAATTGAIAFLIYVKGHVLIMNTKGETVVDTAPRKADRRAIVHVHAIYSK